MFQDIENLFKKNISDLYVEKGLTADSGVLDKIVLEVSPEKLSKEYDISTNIAMIIAKDLKTTPMCVAEKIIEKLETYDIFENVNVSNPAFINIKLSDRFLLSFVEDVLKNGDKNIIKNLGNNEKVNIEFCSANPTGPLHIGHTRGIVIGDVLASMFSRSGYDVCREYYINDAGGQMEKLEKSIQCRMKNQPIPSDCYAGEYLQKIADKRLIEEQKCLKNGEPIKNYSKQETAKEMIDTFILPTLKRINVKFDVFSSEQDLKEHGLIEKSVDYLNSVGLLYRGILEPPKGQKLEDWEPREQLLFKSTKFNDDVDRPLAKNDGSHTYFASDIAYHYDKYHRGFKNMIVVLGADHKGYVKRLSSAVKAVSDNNANIHIKLYELVNFVKNGEIVKMSKRKNNFLTVDDVIDEIDVDILRFIILTRKTDTVLNFDLNLVKEQSKENPIWYIQYAYSRCCSVVSNAKQQGIVADENTYNGLSDLLKNENKNIALPYMFHKMLVQLLFYTRFFELSVKNFEPYFFASYMIQTATLFHSIWSSGITDKELKFIQDDNEKGSNINISIAKCVGILIKSGLNTFGIKEMERM